MEKFHPSTWVDRFWLENSCGSENCGVLCTQIGDGFVCLLAIFNYGGFSLLRDRLFHVVVFAKGSWR